MDRFTKILSRTRKRH